MRTLHASTSTWLQLIPAYMTPLKRTIENMKEPLYRFFEREVTFGVKLVGVVRQDLEDVVAITSSVKKQTNHLRALVQQLTKSIIPSAWLGTKSCSVVSWITNFSMWVK